MNTHQSAGEGLYIRLGTDYTVVINQTKGKYSSLSSYCSLRLSIVKWFGVRRLGSRPLSEQPHKVCK